MKEDHQLIDWIQGEDLGLRDKALKQLYQKYFLSVEKLVLNNKGTPNDAKDIFQEGIIVLYNQLLSNAFQGKSTLGTYLYSICRLLWLKKLKRVKQSFPLLDQRGFEDIEENALERLIGTERERHIEGLLEKLGDECNKILKFFYYDKLSMKKIQSQLQLTSVQVVKNKKMKCLNRLKKMVLESEFYQNILKA